MKLGYIGLGALGGAFVQRLLTQQKVMVWDREPGAVTRAAGFGGKPAESAADLARNCDTILTCLPRSADVHQLLFAPGGVAEALAPGTLVIDQTSGIPAETRATARRLQSQGVDMVDAAVSGSPGIVVQGGATLMMSGPEQALGRARPVLAMLTDKVHQCGANVGDGQAMKMVNNALNGGCRVGTLEIVALGRKMGRSLRHMSDTLNAGAGANQTTDRMLPALVEGRQSTDFALALMTKDLSQAVALGMEFGVPMPVSSTVRGLLQIGVNTLGPAARLEDIVGLVETMAATRLAEPATESGSDDAAAKTIDGCAAALGTALTYECLALGLKYGLQLGDMARILPTTSGWSAALRRILPGLAAGTPVEAPKLSALVADLRAGAAAAIECGAPTMVLNVVRGIIETAANVFGAEAAADVLGAPQLAPG